jgi:glycosyltransferase involved in cell wall biosynthesis
MTGRKHDFPLVTVGVTCFNAAGTVAEAIGSALDQDWPNLEVVVVDDGSSDESEATIRGAMGEDPRVRFIRHGETRGYATALNTVIDAAAGEFIAVFDDDDISRPDRISRQWRRLTEYEGATGAENVLCYSNRDVVKAGVEGRAGHVRAIGRAPVEPHGPPVADFLLWHYEDAASTWGQLGSCTLFVRRKTLLDIGGFDPDFRRAAEWDMAIRAALAGAHFIAVDEPLITQRITPTADKGGDIPLKATLQLRTKHKRYLKSRGVYAASRAIARARFCYATGRLPASRAYLALACACSPFRVLPNELQKRKRRRRSANGE